MSPASSTDSENRHRQKRVRKGTHSCWECKRRKIRCLFAPESGSICSGCLARGTTCISQEYAEADTQKSSTVNGLGDRIGRVEFPPEKLIEKVGGVEDKNERRSIATEGLQNPGIDVLTPSSTVSSHYENAPVMSIFTNSGFEREITTDVSNNLHSINSVLNAETSSHNSMLQYQSKVSRLRIALAALLPSQKVIDAISEASDGWWLIQKHFGAKGDYHANILGGVSLASISASHPTVIGSALMCIAICIQQIQPTFELRLSPAEPAVDLYAMMQKYVTVIATHVISDDELIGSLEGLECLILQGLYHINGGRLRNSWLCFRRALSTAQLMGLHRGSRRVRGIDRVAARRMKTLWIHIVQADRYIGLILGLPYGVRDEHCDLDFDEEEARESTIEEHYYRKLSLISGHIIDRNQSESSAFAATQLIDEELESLVKETPAGWWDLPLEIPTERTTESQAVYERLMAQIWYHQLEVFLHLPFMIKSATEPRYEYSKISCLKASREMIKRYVVLRQEKHASFCCKIIDFQAFTASVTLLLHLLGPHQANSFYLEQHMKEDFVLVDKVTGILEELALVFNGEIAIQALKVLKILRAIDLTNPSYVGELKLAIPYFGTICFAKPYPAPPKDVVQLPTPSAEIGISSLQFELALSPMEQSQDTAYLLTEAPNNLSVLSYTSSFFPPLSSDEELLEDWLCESGDCDTDNMSIQNMFGADLNENWAF